LKRLEIDTLAGPLRVWPRGDYIPARFDDVARARAHFGIEFINQGRLNPYSGKWNFGQGYLFGVALKDRPPIEAALLAEFERELRAIVPERA
jgi:hypothetical protein